METKTQYENRKYREYIDFLRKKKPFAGKVITFSRRMSGEDSSPAISLDGNPTGLSAWEAIQGGASADPEWVKAAYRDSVPEWLK